MYLGKCWPCRGGHVLANPTHLQVRNVVACNDPLPASITMASTHSSAVSGCCEGVSVCDMCAPPTAHGRSMHTELPVERVPSAEKRKYSQYKSSTGEWLCWCLHVLLLCVDVE